ncbi:hypothetical protein KSP40_PGU018655 [Platanthera guangdongensis]|uniref:Uncharacterized protein n=1 Tax=Platanthera guangdongensis TaxID=2320717 RepID=A0ABR2M1Y1_9ASPA
MKFALIRSRNKFSSSNILGESVGWETSVDRERNQRISTGRGSLGALVKVSSCDFEVTGSSPRGLLLQICRVRRMQSYLTELPGASTQSDPQVFSMRAIQELGYSCIGGG